MNWLCVYILPYSTWLHAVCIKCMMLVNFLCFAIVIFSQIYCQWTSYGGKVSIELIHLLNEGGWKIDADTQYDKWNQVTQEYSVHTYKWVSSFNTSIDE